MKRLFIFFIIYLLKAYAVFGSPLTEGIPDSLLSLHSAALGGDSALRSFTSFAYEAEIELLPAGMKGSIRSWSMRPCMYRGEASFGLLEITQGYDGERAWTLDQNGMVIFSEDSSSAKQRKTMCLIENYWYLEKKNGVKTAYGGKEESVFGRSCDVLIFHVDQGYTFRILLDPRTYLADEIVIETDTGIIAREYKDYKWVAGLRIPFTITINNRSFGQAVKTILKSVELNPDLDPSLFIPPSSGPDDYSFRSGDRSEGIPFLYSGGHIFLPVTIAGSCRTEYFLLDSGAGMTVIDSTKAASIGLDIGGKVYGTGIGGGKYCYITSLPGFSVEGVDFKDQTVMACDIAGQIERYTGVAISGILGYDFLSRFVTRIDYPSCAISLYEPDSFIPDQGAFSVEAPLMHKVFSIECTLDGMFAGPFLVDTGANRSMLLPRFAEKNGIPTGNTVSIEVMGAAGMTEALMARFRTFRFGRTEIPDPVFFIGRDEGGVSSFEDICGIVGNDILEKFVVTLDYSRQMITLRENPDCRFPPRTDKSGLILELRGVADYYINYVIPDSPAFEAGMKAGDRITSIDGSEASSFGSMGRITRLFQADEGTVYSVTVERNGESFDFTIVLRDYLERVRRGH